VLVRHRYCGKLGTDNDDGGEGLEELITGSVTCMPISSESRGNTGPMHRLQIRATFLQKIKNDGSFSLLPTLAFSAVLPVDSDAFVCAKRGDLQGLLRLLNEGKASLWDCDTGGRQLLHVRKRSF